MFLQRLMRIGWDTPLEVLRKSVSLPQDVMPNIYNKQQVFVIRAHTKAPMAQILIALRFERSVLG